jgi:hypothetical protein
MQTFQNLLEPIEQNCGETGQAKAGGRVSFCETEKGYQ